MEDYQIKDVAELIRLYTEKDARMAAATLSGKEI